MNGLMIKWLRNVDLPDSLEHCMAGKITNVHSNSFT